MSSDLVGNFSFIFLVDVAFAYTILVLLAFTKGTATGILSSFEF